MERRGTNCRALARGLVLALALAPFGSLIAFAAAPEDQNASAAAVQPDPDRTPDFFFSRPRGSIGFRGGWTFASAGSDLFDFVTRELTLEKQDFNSPSLGGEVTIDLTPRAAVEVGFDWHRTEQPSSYRSLVDNNFNEIEQFTRLKTVNLGAGLRYALTPRGHDVSRFAWVPRRAVPYIGAGAGLIWYDFMQSGDFVDFQDSRVFTDVFRAKGWAPSVHVFGGVDVRVFRALYVSTEARYLKAAGDLGEDFVDFDPIDLSGLKISAGINVVF